MNAHALMLNNLTGAPRSVQLIFEALTDNGEPLGLDALVEKTNLTKRTVRYALGRLLASELITRIPDLNDLRKGLYAIPSAQKDGTQRQ
ncbi:MAG: hypothetical protein ACFFB3_00465 [Candidatus Hodarchaeota archaeon]